MGLARTCQIVQPFPELSVLDNTAAGALFSGAAASLALARHRAASVLKRVGLDAEAGRPAGAGLAEAAILAVATPLLRQ